MGPIENLNHWHSQATRKGFRGPTHGALLYPDGSFKVADLRDPGLDLLTFPQGAFAWALGRGGEHSEEWWAHARDLLGRMLTSPMGTLPTTAGLILEKVQEANVALGQMDPWILLEMALRGTDWGKPSQTLEVLHPLILATSPDRARELWGQYAPPTQPFPSKEITNAQSP
jgi:hypothetical protein